MSEWHFTGVRAETYRCKTFVPATEEGELRIYEIPSDEITDFVVRIEDPQHAERIIDIEPLDGIESETSRDAAAE